MFQGSGPGELWSPEGITVDGPYLYVADFGNHRVVVYRKDNYQFIREIGAAPIAATDSAPQGTKKPHPLKHEDSEAHLARIHDLLHRDAVARHEHDELVAAVEAEEHLALEEEELEHQREERATMHFAQEQGDGGAVQENEQP